MSETGNEPQGGDSKPQEWNLSREHEKKLIELAELKAELTREKDLTAAQEAKLKKAERKLRELEKAAQVKVVPDKPEEEDKPAEAKAEDTPAEEPVHREKGFSIFFWEW